MAKIEAHKAIDRTLNMPPRVFYDDGSGSEQAQESSSDAGSGAEEIDEEEDVAGADAALAAGTGAAQRAQHHGGLKISSKFAKGQACKVCGEAGHAAGFVGAVYVVCHFGPDDSM